MGVGDYPPREEAIISSMAKFIEEYPGSPACGRSWRDAFAAGERFTAGRVRKLACGRCRRGGEGEPIHATCKRILALARQLEREEGPCD